LLLALMRRIPEAAASSRRGQWERDAFRGRELWGRRLGILGCGRIGGQVARYGLAFGMPVAAYDRNTAGPWPDGIERCDSLAALLRRSEVLSVHLPLDASTRGIIGRRELQWLPRGAVVVNTARGGLIDEAALADLLATGHLSGAALDVIEGELDPRARRRSPILVFASQHPEVVVTPHLGGATVESMRRTERFMAEKLRDWARTQDASRVGGTVFA
jgi:D-3-phosphoglycerate dehydrogenase